MSWVKLDDSFADHPKVVGLSDGAFRAFIDGLCYCGRQLTDGHIPSQVMLKITKAKERRELLDAGLWDMNGSGVHVHDYLEYQSDAATIRQRRRKDSERKNRGIREHS